MLAKIMPPIGDFHKLADYFVRGKIGNPSTDHVQWVFAQNSPSHDPYQVAKFMEATAALSYRTKKPAYHVMIAWSPDEDPTPELMQDIARKTLDMADLGEHEALVMGHSDTDHKHLHMLINRVHPVTGKAWSTSNDFKRFDRIMKILAEEYKFRPIPAHTFAPEHTFGLPKKPKSPAYYAAKRGAPTNRSQWPKQTSQAFGALISENLDHGTSFDDLEFIVAEHGLSLEEKGHGLVVGNSQAYTKFSALGLKLSAASLAKTRHRRRRSASPLIAGPSSFKTRSVFDVDAVDIARAFQTLGLAPSTAVRDAVLDAQAQRDAKMAKASPTAQMAYELRKSLRTKTALATRKTLSSKRPRRTSKATHSVKSR